MNDANARWLMKVRCGTMKEMGVYNLMYIMTQMNNVDFTLKSLIAIRKATQNRVIELMDAFVE